MTLVKKLTLSDVVDMIAHFIWVPSLFNTFCNSIKEEHFDMVPEHIDRDETCLAYIWGALKEYYESQGTKEVPDRSRLEVYIRSYLRGVKHDENMTEDMVEERLFGEDPELSFLPSLYDEERQTLNYESGLKLARDFLYERAIVNGYKRHYKDMQGFEGYIDTDETDALRRLSEDAARIDAITAEIELQPAIPDLSIFKAEENKKIIPTGTPWVDAYIDDGQRYGEVNGLFGPTGSGKTTLGCQLFVSNVQKAFNDWRDGKDNRFCVYYTYEQSASEVQREKIISAAFKIARSSIKAGQDFISTFSRGDFRKDYELERKLSEYDRYYAEAGNFNQHGFVRNMSGVPDLGDSEQLRQRKMHAGEGGIDELVHDLEFIIGQREKAGIHQGVRAVFIDYMGLVIDRQYKDRDEKDRWNAMRSFGNEIRMKIAGAFDCTVWLLHQMSGTANAKNPTTPLLHTDAAGCKSLADNMANCLCLGRKDKETGCLYLTFSKTRHSGNSEGGETDLILQHNPTYAMLDNVTGKYKADRGNGHFYCEDETIF